MCMDYVQILYLLVKANQHLHVGIHGDNYECAYPESGGWM